MDFYHPLGKAGSSISPSPGRSANEVACGDSGDIYAMKAGTASVSGTDLIITVSESDNNLGVPLQITYSGGTFNINDGNVTQGQKIGTVGSIIQQSADTNNDIKDDTTNSDTTAGADQAVSGENGAQQLYIKVSGSSGEDLTGDVNVADNTFMNKKIIDDVNLEKALSYSGGSTYSYCGLIFASKFETRTSGGGPLTMSPQEFYNKAHEKGWNNNAKWTLAVMRVMNGLMQNGCCGATAAVLAGIAVGEMMVYCIEDSANNGLTLSNSPDDVKITWGGGHGNFRSCWAWLTGGSGPAAQSIAGNYSPEERNINSKVDSCNIQCAVIAEIATKGKSGTQGAYWNHTTGNVPNMSSSQMDEIIKTGIDPYMRQHPTELKTGVYIWEAFYEHHGGANNGVNDYGGHASPRAIAFAYAAGFIS